MLLTVGMALLLGLLVLDLWRRTAEVGRTVAGGVLRGKDGKVVGVSVVQRCPRGLEFSIRRESNLDALATQLGLSREPRLGVRHLDQDLYLETDDPGVARRLGEDATVQEALHALFARAPAQAWRLLQLDGRNGQLVARALCSTEPGARRAAALFAPHLSQLAGSLQGAARGGGRDPLPGRARALLALPTATAVLALTGQAFHGLFGYRLLEPWALLWATLPWSLAATVLYLLLCVVALRRGARTHRVLLEGGVLALAGFAGTAYWAAYVANRELDTVGVRSLGLVEGEYDWSWSGGCRHGWCVSLEFPEWRPGRDGARFSIPVVGGERTGFVSWSEVPRRPVVELSVRGGFLGFPWVERVIRREHDPLRDRPWPAPADDPPG